MKKKNIVFVPTVLHQQIAAVISSRMIYSLLQQIPSGHTGEGDELWTESNLSTGVKHVLCRMLKFL